MQTKKEQGEQQGVENEASGGIYRAKSGAIQKGAPDEKIPKGHLFLGPGPRAGMDERVEGRGTDKAHPDTTHDG